jgi:class 3 adenylate cyclase
MDIRDVLPAIRVPTLVLHRRDDRMVSVEMGRYIADHIPGAKFVELPGRDHLPFVGDQDAILDEIEEFLTGARHAPDYDRVLATVLTARLVGAPAPSPDSAASAGRGLLFRFLSHVKKEIELFRGRASAMTDATVTATFDGPARAIRCAWAIIAISRRLDVEVAAGLHTGECDLLDDSVSGTAVEISASVASKAAVGELLVSGTLKDIVAGSGIDFEDRGVDVIEGFGEFRVFAVTRCS